MDDADWISVLTKVFRFVRIQKSNSYCEQEDAILPSPEDLCARLMSSRKIREKDGGSIFRAEAIRQLIVTNI